MEDYTQLAYKLRKALGAYLLPFTAENVGTFTPVFAGTGTAGTWTYSVQTGFYSRIGNRVLFNLNVAAATRPGVPTGNATITGLPFTSNATANNNQPCSLEVSGLTLSGTNTMLMARVAASQTRIDLTELLGTAPGTAGFLAATGLTATAQVEISGQYML
jgi:hypothetical protein